MGNTYLELAGALGKFTGSNRYDGPHRSQAVKSSSEIGLDRNFSRALMTLIFCISFYESLPSFGPFPLPSTNSKSMCSHLARKSEKPACSSGYFPRISQTSV